MHELHGYDPKSLIPSTPLLTFQFQCYHCKCYTVVSVDSVAKSEIQMWKDRYESLLSKMNTAIELCHKQYGTDPMSEYMYKQLLDIREKLY